jgi:hypothetical protein
MDDTLLGLQLHTYITDYCILLTYKLFLIYFYSIYAELLLDPSSFRIAKKA